MRAYFEHFSRPVQVRVANDRATGRSKGCAFLVRPRSLYVASPSSSSSASPLLLLISIPRHVFFPCVIHSLSESPPAPSVPQSYAAVMLLSLALC